MNNEGNTNLFDTVPERLVDFEKDGLGNTVLLIPRFRRGLCAKWLQPRLKKPYYRLALDDIGSFVWERCDGKMKVGEIAALLEGRFGEKVKPVESRLKLFFTTLFQNKVIRYWQLNA